MRVHGGDVGGKQKQSLANKSPLYVLPSSSPLDNDRASFSIQGWLHDRLAHNSAPHTDISLFKTLQVKANDQRGHEPKILGKREIPTGAQMLTAAKGHVRLLFLAAELFLLLKPFGIELLRILPQASLERCADLTDQRMSQPALNKYEFSVLIRKNGIVDDAPRPYGLVAKPNGLPVAANHQGHASSSRVMSTVATRRFSPGPSLSFTRGAPRGGFARLAPAGAICW